MPVLLVAAACSSPTSPTADLEAPVSGFSQAPAFAFEPTAPSPQHVDTPAFVQSVTVNDIGVPPVFGPAAALPQPAGLKPCPGRPASASADALAQAMRTVVAIATNATRPAARRTAVVFFTIEEPDPNFKTHIAGELYRTDVRRDYKAAAMGIEMLVVPGTLRFPDRTAFLEALRAAVPFAAEVRLTGRDLVPTCRRAGAMTGRIEGAYR